MTLQITLSNEVPAGTERSGKDHLLKMIAGASAPDAGSVRLGASVTMGYFAQQSLDVLDPNLTVIEQLQRDFPQDGLGSLRTLAGAFQFSGDDVDKRIRALSGGEKSRLGMARMLYNPPNFLVLDEPTNHLALATKEMLVEALKDFAGTMIFVSHGRMFLRGLGSRVLSWGGEWNGSESCRLSGIIYRLRSSDRSRGTGPCILTVLSIRYRGLPRHRARLVETPTSDCPRNHGTCAFPGW